MKIHFLLPIISIIFLGCGFSKPTSNPESSVHSIEVEKKTICINEEVQISIKSNNNSGIIYKIGNKTGNPVILTYSKPGEKTIDITINDTFDSKIKHEQVKINVEDCHLENTISITAYPEKFNMGILNFKTEMKPAKILKYKWNFGDGKSEFTTTPFIQHDYRTRIQKDLYSSFIVKIIAFGSDGKEYSARTSISIPNIHFLSKRMGTPTIPIKYDRFPIFENEKLIINFIYNNIYEEPFYIDEILINFKSHKTETHLKEFIFDANKLLESTEVSGGQVYESQISIPTSIVPENSTRLSIKIKGTLNHEQNTYSNLFIDLPPKNDEIANGQEFEEVKNQVLIRKLEQAEKIYGKGRPISAGELKMMEVNHE